MKQSGTCPKCNGREFLVLTSSEHLLFVGMRKCGRSEQWICGGCGYAETWTEDIARAFAAPKRLPDHARIVQTAVAGGAYR